MQKFQSYTFSVLTAILVDQIAEQGLQSLKMSSSQAAGGSTWKCRRTLGPGSCWASLPEDLIRMVASRLLDSDFLDYVRFQLSARAGGPAPPPRVAAG